MSAQSSYGFAEGLKGAIRNPENLNHFMVVQKVAKRVRIYLKDKQIADTTDALRVIEMSTQAYEPRYYVPMEDVTATLKQTETAPTHCPLKGDATYYSIDGIELSWCYATYDFAKILEDHYAFWGQQVRFIEGD